MTVNTEHQVEHEILVNAEPATVYRLIAEVENWPQIFPPSVYVDYLERGEDQERIRIWATANGEAKNWTSLRRLDPTQRRIEFHQEVSSPPVAAMSGTWIAEPTSNGATRLRLLHAYRAVDDAPDDLAWIDQAVDRNSRAELASLKKSVELATGSAELTQSFEDAVTIEGRAQDAYDFVNEAHLWKDRLPHVAQVELTEQTPGLQTLRMDTLTKDGSSHTTESVRVCFPHWQISYKQTTLPALMTLHTGRWTFEEHGDGTTTAISQHTVTINPDTITTVLGPDAGVSAAREFLRNALGNNSRATLGYAKSYAEARR